MWLDWGDTSEASATTSRTRRSASSASRDGEHCQAATALPQLRCDDRLRIPAQQQFSGSARVAPRHFLFRVKRSSVNPKLVEFFQDIRPSKANGFSALNKWQTPFFHPCVNGSFANA